MRQRIIENIEAHKKAIEYFENHSVDTIIEITEMVTQVFDNGGCIYLCGNGGSLADCQHLAGEFVGRFRNNRKPLPAVALSTDAALVTCIGNDYSFDEIFSRQVEALVKPIDLLWAFSTSGKSPNILAAVEKARQKQARVVAFTGRSDSLLEKMADLCLCAASDATNNSQEVHELAYHIICDLIDEKY